MFAFFYLPRRKEPLWAHPKGDSNQNTLSWFYAILIALVIVGSTVYVVVHVGSHSQFKPMEKRILKVAMVTLLPEQKKEAPKKETPKQLETPSKPTPVSTEHKKVIKAPQPKAL